MGRRNPNVQKAYLPVVKNECYDMEITSIGSNGEGIGRIEGYTLFVDGATEGDKVKVKVIKTKKNYGVGRLIDIISPSSDRIEARCPVARQCGGCHLQHIHYHKQLTYKETSIANCLERIGKLDKEEVQKTKEPIIGADEPWFYRNKVQFPVRDNQGKLEIGFYAKRSHRIIETPRCYIQDTRNESIIEVIREVMTITGTSAYNEENHQGLLRHIMIRKSKSQDAFYVSLVINGKDLPEKEAFIEGLTDLSYVKGISLNVNEEQTNVIMGQEIIQLFGDLYMEDTIGDTKFRVSPLSFYQVNPEQTYKLYSKALDYAQLSGDETVFDLYCGIGTISLFVAKKAKNVYGVEIVPEAIEDAQNNARLNNYSNAHFYVGKSEDIMPKLYEEEGIKADVVILDPPRRGCEEALLQTICHMSPSKIVYVSCDPATLARDVKYLSDNGYKLDKWCGVDMFSQTTHVECVVGISRKH